MLEPPPHLLAFSRCKYSLFPFAKRGRLCLVWGRGLHRNTQVAAFSRYKSRQRLTHRPTIMPTSGVGAHAAVKTERPCGPRGNSPSIVLDGSDGSVPLPLLAAEGTPPVLAAVPRPPLEVNDPPSPSMSPPSFLARWDAIVARSWVGRHFKLEERGTCFSREAMGGWMTFLTMSYITPLSASIVAETGATCDIHAPDNVYESCKFLVRHQLLTAVAVASFVSSLVMGLWVNLPFLLAPGIGTSAYFAYSVVGVRGLGHVPYRTGVTAVVLEGVIFLLLSITGLRSRAVQSLPSSIKLAMSGGIGLFLAFIGLQAPEGIGLITASPDTLVTLGGCPPAARSPVNDGAGTYVCMEKRMQSATTWMGLTALLLMTTLLEKGVRSAVGVVILLVSLLSWVRDTPFSFFPRDGPDGVGEARFQAFRKLISIQGMADVAGQWEFGRLGSPQVWLAVLTFLYTDVLDTTGCLYSMVRQAGMVQEDGRFEGDGAAFCVDALGTILAGSLGLPPVVVFMESAVGIECGARTGLAAVVGSLGFLLSVIFTPILASIPPFATGAALILVGCILMEHLSHIQWTNRHLAMPAFLTAILMPLTYSIAYGVIAGIVTAIIIHLLLKFFDKVSASLGRFASRGVGRCRLSSSQQKDHMREKENLDNSESCRNVKHIEELEYLDCIAHPEGQSEASHHILAIGEVPPAFEFDK